MGQYPWKLEGEYECYPTVSSSREVVHNFCSGWPPNNGAESWSTELDLRSSLKMILIGISIYNTRFAALLVEPAKFCVNLQRYLTPPPFKELTGTFYDQDTAVSHFQRQYRRMLAFSAKNSA